MNKVKGINHEKEADFDGMRISDAFTRLLL
jgi:hypothetical protein